jgi:hypothetical protein
MDSYPLHYMPLECNLAEWRSQRMPDQPTTTIITMMPNQLISALFVTALLGLPTSDVLAESNSARNSGIQSEFAAEIVRGKAKRIKPGRYSKASLEAELDLSGPRHGRKKLSLQLPGGRQLQLQRQQFKQRSRDDALWIGKVTDIEDSEAVLTIRKGRMAGRVRVNDDVYEIRPGRGTRHVVREVDTAALPQCGVGPEQSIESLDGPADLLMNPAVASAADDGGTTVIQLLTVYTPAAMAYAGSAENLEVMIQSAVDNTNAAFSNSEMNIEFELLHTQEVNHTEQVSTNADLSWLTYNSEVATLRDEYGADMVSMITDAEDVCGLGWLQRDTGAYFEKYAYSVTTVDCAVGNLTFAHEHGHNMGMEHDRANSGIENEDYMASFPWSFGYYVDGSFRTVMSYYYPCVSGCPRAPQFSNPAVSYTNSLPTGVIRREDNAQTGNIMAPLMAKYRSSTFARARINEPYGDVEESAANGAVYTDSSDLELGYDSSRNSNQYVGLRFTNIDVPAGVEITRAYLEFAVDETSTINTNASIRAIAEDSAAPFTGIAYEVSSRLTTTALTNWTVPSWYNTGDLHRSPDLSAIIQEVINRGGWSVGNAMAFVVTALGERTAESFEGGAATAPLLHIEYGPPQSTVTVDVLPGDAANQVYPNEAGKLPVAILSSADFDATQISAQNLRFGPAGALPAEPLEFSDIDGLHGLDTTAQFDVPEAGILCNDTEAELSGLTYSGDAFAGSDMIDATQCEDGGCHAY